ncbi:unnamed protein product [Bursaphelenchus okinawaensis]|uniref:MADF domain-containing protein n=1 Tax=Bursaphelenchus okinawaensis TaxID=465554 RepID=A0A811K335_9BILA|nr:unnamed protein product [Bursaphelenchus okinawaensis]CAG9091145.1 unnamed protein product [Bursaphelenchus okinawaensis]
MSDRPPTFNELLIREVQNHPELYDQQHRVCTDNEERNMMWEVIARRIDENVTGEFAKKRWLQMRDRYRKELKMALRNMTQPKWPYFEKLSWLDPYLKDSKSAGLHPTFLGCKLESTEKNILESLHKFSEAKQSQLWNPFPNENQETSEFSYQHTVNTDSLLQNIMAASSTAFEHLQRRDDGEYSPPDSAVASTSEDGDVHINVQPSSTTASEAGSSASSHVRNQSASPEHESQPIKSDESSSNSESGQSVEQLTLDTSLLSMPGLTNPDGSLSFMGSVLRNLSATVSNNPSQTPRANSRNRNPPYLVRRGGGIKIKQERTAEVRGFKPLAKTMSVGVNQATNLLNLNGISDKDLADERLPEWTTDEDVLFARLVAVRLKKFGAKDKRIIRSRISEFMDEKEEQIELNKVRSG